MTAAPASAPPTAPSGRLRGQAGRFVVVGAIATLVHYGIYYVLCIWLPVWLAYTIGYGLSFLLNFYLTARYTFRTPPSWTRLAGMSGAHIVNYLVQLGLLTLYIRLGVDHRWAPLGVYAVAVPLNFVLVRYVFIHRSS